MSKNYTNIIGAIRIDDKRSALALKALKVNNTPKLRRFAKENGQVDHLYYFPSNLSGSEFNYNKIEFALGLKKGTLKPNQYGVSVNVGVKASTANQLEKLSTRLVKGAKLKNLVGTVNYDPEYGLQLTLSSLDIGFIESPYYKDESHEKGEPAPVAACATEVEPENLPTEWELELPF